MSVISMPGNVTSTVVCRLAVSAGRVSSATVAVTASPRWMGSLVVTCMVYSSPLRSAAASKGRAANDRRASSRSRSASSLGVRQLASLGRVVGEHLPEGCVLADERIDA